MKILCALVLLLAAGVVGATSGGVDAKGCHDSKKMGVHCHPLTAKSGGSESASERDKRMRRECRNLPNAGMCLGYGYQPGKK